MGKFIIRLDDACPTMDRGKWGAIEEILDAFYIKPIAAVIPDNEDPEMKVDEHDEAFWIKVKNWQDKGWHIAMHGCNHLYTNTESGLVPITKQSEFAGVSTEIQAEKIKKGYDILRGQGVEPEIWVAPSHSFDENTLKVLKEETDIRIISDGLAYYPYSEKGFFWMPMQLWKLKKRYFGVWTVCFHPNLMGIDEIVEMREFIKNNRKDFIDNLDEICKMYGHRQKNILDEVFRKWFFSKDFLVRSLISCDKR